MIQIVLYGSNSVLLAGLVSILNCQSNLEVVGSFLDRVSPIQVSDCQADLFLLEQTPQIDVWWLERWLFEADFELGGIFINRFNYHRRNKRISSSWFQGFFYPVC